jgi:hypothetical protein
MPTPREWAGIVAEAVELHCGDFPAQWAKDTELAIANAVGKAVLEERDRCARLAEREWACTCHTDLQVCEGCVQNHAAKYIAAAIRGSDAPISKGD